MKIFRLSGGLGNQLFSYAACYQYCLDHKEPIVMDTSIQEAPWFFRNFDLAHYNIQMDKKIWYRVGDGRIDHLLLNHVHRRRAIGLFTPTIYEDRSGYHPETLEKLPKHCYVIGDWQYLGYFDKYRDKLREIFPYRDQLAEGALGWEQDIRIKGRHSVAVHARRGDIAKMGGALGAEYFIKAIKTMAEKVPDPVFYCFSEDLNWLRNTFMPFKEQFEFKYTEYDSNSKGLEDFELMRKCSHQIIANSTYSWWAAYLNENPDKVVIHPGDNKKGYWPEGWIAI